MLYRKPVSYQNEHRQMRVTCWGRNQMSSSHCSSFSINLSSSNQGYCPSNTEPSGWSLSQASFFLYKFSDNPQLPPYAAPSNALRYFVYSEFLDHGYSPCNTPLAEFFG